MSRWFHIYLDGCYLCTQFGNSCEHVLGYYRNRPGRTVTAVDCESGHTVTRTNETSNEKPNKHGQASSESTNGRKVCTHGLYHPSPVKAIQAAQACPAYVATSHPTHTPTCELGMRRKRHTKIAKWRKHSLVLGIIGDLLFITGWIAKIAGLPVHWLARAITRFFKRHKALKPLQSHTLVCVIIGLCVLTASFALAEISHRAVWQAVVESLRAIGACPIWENVSAKLVQAERV